MQQASIWGRLGLVLVTLGFAACDTGSRHDDDTGSTGGGSTAWTLVTDVAPSTGASSGGTNVAIAGTNFAVTSQVFFGQVQATVLSVSPTQILAVSPALTGQQTPLTAPFAVDVVVMGGPNVAYRNQGFTYDDTNGGGTTPPNGVLARVADHALAGTTGPTGAEQELLELINRARRDPTAEGDRLGINLSGYSAKAPISYNGFLDQGAQGHAQDMIDRNFYGHMNPDGDNASGRLFDTNYALHAVYGDPNQPADRQLNLSENIGVGMGNQFNTPQAIHDSFMIDAGLTPPKHRNAILGSEGTFLTAREVGMGTLFNQPAQAQTPDNLITSQTGDRLAFSPEHYAVQEFAKSTTDRAIILGTVYNDANNDGICNDGEGLAGQTVILTHATGFTIQTTTAAAGGYAFETFVNTDFTIQIGAQSTTVSVAADNVKVDSIGGTVTTY